MFSSTTGEAAGEHSAPLTIASDEEAVTPSAPHAAAAAGGGGGGAEVGGGVGLLGEPPPQPARQIAATTETNACLIEADSEAAGPSILPRSQRAARRKAGT
jgi:hypothetical protein